MYSCNFAPLSFLQLRHRLQNRRRLKSAAALPDIVPISATLTATSAHALTATELRSIRYRCELIVHDVEIAWKECCRRDKYFYPCYSGVTSQKLYVLVAVHHFSCMIISNHLFCMCWGFD